MSSSYSDTLAGGQYIKDTRYITACSARDVEKRCRDYPAQPLIQRQQLPSLASLPVPSHRGQLTPPSILKLSRVLLANAHSGANLATLSPDLSRLPWLL